MELGEVMEHTTAAVTADVSETLNRMSLAGWEHYQTMPGVVDGDALRQSGVTLFFRRPVGIRRPVANGDAKAEKAKRR